MQRGAAHGIRFFFQIFIVVNRHARAQLHGRLDPALRLLSNVPGFVRQMFLLARRQVYVLSLRIGKRVDRRGLRRIVMNSDAIQ